MTTAQGLILVKTKTKNTQAKKKKRERKKKKTTKSQNLSTEESFFQADRARKSHS